MDCLYTLLFPYLYHEDCLSLILTSPDIGCRKIPKRAESCLNWHPGTPIYYATPWCGSRKWRVGIFVAYLPQSNMCQILTKQAMVRVCPTHTFRCMKYHYPICVECHRVDHKWTFSTPCRGCGQVHTHGTLGHHAAHCETHLSPLHQNGYVLVEAEAQERVC